MRYIGQLYEIERDVQPLAAPSRLEVRQQRARPVADALHAWMTAQRARVSEGSAIARALDYSLRRWVALTRYLDDPDVPIDNNWCENQIRPIATGRSLCTSFRNLGKHWELPFNVVATRAMFARQRRRNSFTAQIACANLPRGIGHYLLGRQNLIVD